MQSHTMQEGEREKRFEAIEQALSVVGDASETVKRDHRQWMDQAPLDLETFRRCLTRFNPEVADYCKMIR